MMRWLLPLCLFAAIIGCGDDTPTGPGNELVGTWVGVSSSDPDVSEEFMQATTMVIRADGTYTISVEIGNVDSVEATLEIAGGKLIIATTMGGETITSSGDYMITATG